MGLLLFIVIYGLFNKFSKWPHNFYERLEREIGLYDPADMGAYQKMQKVIVNYDYIPLDEALYWVEEEIRVLEDMGYHRTPDLSKLVSYNIP